MEDIKPFDIQGGKFYGTYQLPDREIRIDQNTSREDLLIVVEYLMGEHKKAIDRERQHHEHVMEVLRCIPALRRP